MSRNGLILQSLIMTNSQRFFIIYFSLEKGLIHYQYSKKLFTSFFELTKDPHILNQNEYIEKIKIDEELKNIKSIVDLLNLSLIFSGKLKHKFELNVFEPFRSIVISNQGTTASNDIDIILDFWYDTPKLFCESGEYKKIILKIIDETSYFEHFNYYHYSRNSQIKGSGVVNYSKLGGLSSSMIRYIELNLGIPDFEIDINKIVERLRLQKRSSYTIELALEIFKNSQVVYTSFWPKMIKNTKK